MANPQQPHTLNQADHDKRRVAISSVGAAVALTGMKLGVGLWTNSLGILAEAAHSGLDLVAAVVTLLAVRISSRPADRDHTYGHGKFENLSALFETLLLLATCVWIIYEAIMRLRSNAGSEVTVTAWSFAVIIISIVVDISRSTALRRVAKKYQSQALEADALHFSTDVWSSCVVLVGLLGILIAQWTGLEWLKKADTVAALGVAVIVIWVSWRLGKKSVDDLLDRIPEELREQAAAAAQQVPGVEQVTQIRLRRSGPEVFADLILSVGEATTFEKAHEIADQAAEAVRSVLPQADVVVHAEPITPRDEDLTTRIRLLAARHGLGAHGIRLYEEDGQQSLELHLEVSESLSLEEADRQAKQFKHDLQAKIPEVKRIVSHLEPTGEATARVQATPADEEQVRTVVEQFLRENQFPLTLHNVKVQETGGELQVSFHVRLAGSTAITDAHDFTVRLEEYLRNRVPNVGRVVIQPQPEKPAERMRD